MFWFKKNTDIDVKYDKKVIIIGGGLSGLISGIHCLLKGMDVTIIEKREGRYKSDPNEKEYTFEIEAETVLEKDIFVPRYFWQSKMNEIEKQAKEQEIELIPIQRLIDEKIIEYEKLLTAAPKDQQQ